MGSGRRQWNVLEVKNSGFSRKSLVLEGINQDLVSKNGLMEVYCILSENGDEPDITGIGKCIQSAAWSFPLKHFFASAPKFSIISSASAYRID